MNIKKYLGTRTAFSFNNEKEWKDFLELLEENNIWWASNKKAKSKIDWYEKEYCLCLRDNAITRGTYLWYKNNGYDIIEAKLFLNVKKGNVNEWN